MIEGIRLYLESLDSGNDLLVGHSQKSLNADRTLHDLYRGPLITILENQDNRSINGKQKNTEGPIGVFQSSPDTTLTLFLDFKGNGTALWPFVNQQLEALRSGNWLSYWESSTNQITWRPIIVVGSGDTPFDLVMSKTTYRDIFYDAPLDDVSDSKYDSTNSYYGRRFRGQKW